MLQIVALPIGNKEDITLRALNALKNADVIIGEERKELIPLLKFYGVNFHSKKIEFLNEHSQEQDISALGRMCQAHAVVLVSDCGTPVFCDPGALLIQYCRQNEVPITTLPGASSLMCLLSLSSQKLTEFYFYGFLPREKEERQRAIQKISGIKKPIVIMDTPYRFSVTVEQLAHQMPQRKALIAADMTLESEWILEGNLRDIVSKVKGQKREFLILLYS